MIDRLRQFSTCVSSVPLPRRNNGLTDLLIADVNLLTQTCDLFN